MSSYDLANERITDDLRNNIEKEDANDYAKDIMKSNEQDLKTSELQPQQPQQPQQPPMPQQPPVPQQYQPPVPNQSQPPIPQQSQQMNSHHQVGGNYTGFDSKDNLSPLDTAFNTKIPVQQPANVNSSMRTNQIENIEAYTPESKMDKFSLF